MNEGSATVTAVEARLVELETEDNGTWGDADAGEEDEEGSEGTVNEELAVGLRVVAAGIGGEVEAFVEEGCGVRDCLFKREARC